MLTFIFGAGASYDSDPANPPGSENDLPGSYDYRPPLAAGLFAPTSDLGKKVLARNPRAIPLVMELAEASRRGRDIEEELERFANDQEYSLTEPDLLAMRAYLAEITTELPNEWLEDCQGRTNYVSLLRNAHRWNCHNNGSQREPLGCITFNYDTLLEDVVAKVFGHTINSIDAYTTSDDVHVYKPHGSVTWRNPATWDIPQNDYHPGRQGLERAIDRAANIKLDSTDTWAHTTSDEVRDPHDGSKIWLPAISIPLRRKSTFNFPPAHKDALLATPGQDDNDRCGRLACPRGTLPRAAGRPPARRRPSRRRGRKRQSCSQHCGTASRNGVHQFVRDVWCGVHRVHGWR